MALTLEKLTLENFLRLPEEKPALEYFEGMVTQKVSPKARLSKLQSEYVERINAYAIPGRVAQAFAELRGVFAGTSPVPDVAILRWDRIPYDDAGELLDDVVGPFDIAIDIVSPDQSTNALVRRCLWYVENGVQVALLTDPDDKSVLAFRPGQAPRVLRGADRIDLDEVLPGFNLTVDELFRSLRRPQSNLRDGEAGKLAARAWHGAAFAASLPASPSHRLHRWGIQLTWSRKNPGKPKVFLDSCGSMSTG